MTGFTGLVDSSGTQIFMAEPWSPAMIQGTLTTAGRPTAFRALGYIPLYVLIFHALVSSLRLRDETASART